MSTLLSRGVRDGMMERVRERIRADAALASDYEEHLGPFPARYYLREHETLLVPPVPEGPRVDPLRATSKELDAAIESGRARRDRSLKIWSAAKLVSVWEFAGDDAREVEPQEWDGVGPGTPRGAYFENAIVDYWIDAVYGEVTATWSFGPRRDGYLWLRIVHRSGRVDLDTLHSDLSRW